MDTETELAELTAKRRQLRIRHNFTRKYGGAGYDALMAAIARHDTLEAMGGIFEVSRQRMGQIIEVLLGIPYSQELTRSGIQRRGMKREANHAKK